MTLKQRFLDAVCMGELGHKDGFGVIVNTKDLKRYFRDIKTDYISSFLPAAVIETGQFSPTHTKYVFRLSKGTYRVHAEAIRQHKSEMYDVTNDRFSGYKVEEVYIHYSAYEGDAALCSAQGYY